MKFIRTRSFFIRYREGITFGILAGVLISNLYLGVVANRTANRVLEISKQIKETAATNEGLSKEARTESERRYSVLIEYMNCLLKNNYLSEVGQNQCYNKATRSIPSQPKTAPIPQTNTQPTPVRQEPTTSAPPTPEQNQKGAIQSLNETVENTLRGVDNMITGILKQD